MKAGVVDAAAASNRRARRPMAIWLPMRRPMFRAAVDIAVMALRAGHICRHHPLRVRGHELAAAGVIAGRRTPASTPSMPSMGTEIWNSPGGAGR
ncbi:hypothetical protein [Noviherbaspirillum suwonense]|uniref:hypothetical protein n=1 Tax=Noviherbaspirillum suwonense TaxID=1224511 RepID=UPI0024B6C711|nr:hypothetical protein [Noviherbaspirillum suwonense]